MNHAPQNITEQLPFTAVADLLLPRRLGSEGGWADPPYGPAATLSPPKSLPPDFGNWRPVRTPLFFERLRSNALQRIAAEKADKHINFGRGRHSTALRFGTDLNEERAEACSRNAGDRSKL
jgi:hypothetical protein